CSIGDEVKKRLIILVLFTLCSLAGTQLASATCVQIGKVVRLYGPPAGGGFVELAPPSIDLVSFVTVFGVPNDRYFSILSSAEGANMTVILYGNAPSCAPTGAFRPGGTLTFADVQRNR